MDAPRVMRPIERRSSEVQALHQSEGQAHAVGQHDARFLIRHRRIEAKININVKREAGIIGSNFRLEFRHLFSVGVVARLVEPYMKPLLRYAISDVDSEHRE